MKIILPKIKVIRQDGGVTAIEYSLLAGLIAVVIVATATLAGEALFTMYERVENEITAIATNSP